MRHRNQGRKLNRNCGHRKALFRNMLRNLFIYGQVITTVPKAKECAGKADKMITVAKRAEMKIAQLEEKLKKSANGELTPELQAQLKQMAQTIRIAHLRRALSKLPDKDIVYKIFAEIAPLFNKRKGGYTSVIRVSQPRAGDNAPQALLKLVEIPPVTAKPEDKQKKAEKDKLNQQKADIRRKRREEKRKEKERQWKEKQKKKIEQTKK